MNMKKFIKTIIEDTGEYGFQLTETQVKRHLKRLPHVTPEMGFDTSDREDFINDIGIYLTGSEWPLNMYTAKYKKKFFISLAKGAKNKRYKYDEEYHSEEIK